MLFAFRIYGELLRYVKIHLLIIFVVSIMPQVRVIVESWPQKIFLKDTLIHSAQVVYWAFLPIAMPHEK